MYGEENRIDCSEEINNLELMRNQNSIHFSSIQIILFCYQSEWVCVCVCVCDPFGEMILAVAVDVSYRPIDPHFALLFTITYLLSTLQRKKNKVSYVHIVR